MDMLKLSLIVLFHPVDAFEYIKKRRNSKFKWIPIIVILLLVLFVRSFSIYFTHFPLASIQPRDANIFLEAVRILLPVLTWVLASYAMTTILDGETLLKETLVATIYSMMPYIVLTIPVTSLSLVLEQDQSKLFSILHVLIWAWVLLLFFMNLKVMNKYSIRKALLVALLGIITMALVWATAALFFAISSQFFSFIQEVILEMKMKVLG